MQTAFMSCQAFLYVTEEKKKGGKEVVEGRERYASVSITAQGFPRLSLRKPPGTPRTWGRQGGGRVNPASLHMHKNTSGCMLFFSYLLGLHSQHQTADRSCKCTPSPVPHRWRVHVAIHSLRPCNSWWKGGENEGIRVLPDWGYSIQKRRWGGGGGGGRGYTKIYILATYFFFNTRSS